MDGPDTDMAEYIWSNYTIRNVLVFTSQWPPALPSFSGLSHVVTKRPPEAIGFQFNREQINGKRLLLFCLTSAEFLCLPLTHSV